VSVFPASPDPFELVPVFMKALHCSTAICSTELGLHYFTLWQPLLLGPCGGDIKLQLPTCWP
jgi:hypothetical protein